MKFGMSSSGGISAFEDKVVQDAVREVLEAIYEQDFLECSHGFLRGGAEMRLGPG
jgi:RNA-directed DNA polymerase